jgi:hypothetical protein
LSDGSIPFLSGCVPDLHFDFAAFEIDCFGGEFDADGGFGIIGKFVFFEP